MMQTGLCLLFLINYSKAYLISVISLEYPSSSTPITSFAWSQSEPLSTLSVLGEFQIEKAAKDLISSYGDHFKDQSFVTLISKSTTFSQTSAKLFAEHSGLNHEILIEDLILSPEKKCQRISWLMQRDRYESKAYLQFWQSLSPHLENLEKVIGKEANISNIYLLGDTVISYNERKIQIPFDEETQKAAVLGYFRYNDLLLYGAKEQGKLATHGFFSYLNQTAHSKTMSEGTIFFPDKALFYAVNKMLGFESTEITLRIEIHDEGMRFYKFFREGKEITMPGCENLCTVLEFLKVMEKRMYKSDKAYFYACGVVGDAQVNWAEYGIYAIGFLAVFLVFMCSTKGAIWTAHRFKEKFV